MIFDQIHDMLMHLGGDAAKDDPELLRFLEAIRWLGNALEPMSHDDTHARQVGVEALHASWARHPEHVDALRNMQATMATWPNKQAMTQVLGVLDEVLSGPTAPDEAALGEALDPALDMLDDLAADARQQAVRSEIRDSVRAHVGDFVPSFFKNPS